MRRRIARTFAAAAMAAGMWRVDPANGQWDDFRCQPHIEPLGTGGDTQWALWVVIYV